MQNTSELYNSILLKPYDVETKLDIYTADGKTLVGSYGEDVLVSASISGKLFSSPSVGAAVGRGISVKMLMPTETLPRMAMLKPCVRISYKGKLPTGYTEVEYIESSDTQYINTGIFPNADYTVETSIQLVSVNGVWDTVFGTRVGSNSRFTARFEQGTNGRFGVQRSTGAGKPQQQYQDGTTIHKEDFVNAFRTIKLAKNVFSYEGDVYHTFSESVNTDAFPYELYLFALNDAGAVNDFGYIRMAYCKMWDENDMLVRNFIPCISPVGEIGMFDTVTQAFFGNSGTGTFLAGKEHTDINKYETATSEWIQKGVYFVDTRSTDSQTGVLTINGYDAMLKTEQLYCGSGDVGQWPRTMATVVNDICASIGVTLDSRTSISSEYVCQLDTTLSMRKYLSYIAVAHGGNWIMTDAGELRLIGLADIPPEVNYLITESGETILFGDTRLLV